MSPAARGLAWLIGTAPPERRGELIGGAIAAALVGVLLGPVLGGAATLESPALVFSLVALLGSGLGMWALTMPGPPAASRSGLRAVGRAMTSRPVVIAFWLALLPALYSGTLVVLGPLRLDELGAGSLAIGAVFLVAAACEGTISAVVGRVSDLDQGYAFALTNLAWAGGQVSGAAAGGWVAERAGDAVPYAGLAVALLSHDRSARRQAWTTRGGRRLALPGTQLRKRVEGPAALVPARRRPELEVQMAALCVAALSHRADLRARRHRSARPEERRPLQVHVGVIDIRSCSIDHDVVPRGCLVAGVADPACPGGQQRRSAAGEHVVSLVAVA
jgi:hypothetical protein